MHFTGSNPMKRNVQIVHGGTKNGDYRLIHRLAKERRALTSLPDGNHFHQTLLLQDREENRVRPSQDLRLACGCSGLGETQWVRNDSTQAFINHHGETSAHSSFLRFIPIAGFLHFFASGRLDEHGKGHPLTPYFENISARTVSEGMPRSGCARASADRLSSSAICSGDNSSSPHSLKIRSAISRCSGAGRRRICSRISVALMPGNYRNSPRGQSSLWSSAKPSHSALS